MCIVRVKKVGASIFGRLAEEKKEVSVDPSVDEKLFEFVVIVATLFFKVCFLFVGAFFCVGPGPFAVFELYIYMVESSMCTSSHFSPVRGAGPRRIFVIDKLADDAVKQRGKGRLYFGPRLGAGDNYFSRTKQ